MVKGQHMKGASGFKALLQPTNFTLGLSQGSGNFEIWIGPADDDDVINEPISKKKKICVYHLSQKLMTIGSPITPFK